MNNVNAVPAKIENLQWETPVLYKEEWINTLGADAPGPENDTTFES